jgi:hypothetical protein
MNQFNSSEWKDASYRVILVADPFRVSLWDQSKSFGAGTGTDRFLFDNLLPILRQSGADVVFTGRTHSYQRGTIESSYPGHEGQPTHLISCSGMAPAHTVQAWSWDISDPPSIVVSSSKYHVVSLDASDLSMSIQCKDSTTGEIIDEVEVPYHTLF